ncbi:MAG TPA: methionyl-tRNA formyltransferase [Spirochaetota bacterium]|nr:methionyl-tRNA formyltransferase [Spirochaetota bacterium]
MRVGFFGTPEIASYVLQHICNIFDIVFLVAPEDKKCGRAMKLQECAAKEFATCSDIPVIQPGNLRDPEFADILKSYNADIFVVVAYGKLIPENIFNMPRCGTINLHPSLLPEYRGAAPVQWALINGDDETGVTVQMINEELDAGDIVLQEKIEIDGEITAGELFEIVFPIGAEMIVKAINLLGSGDADLKKQVHSEATYCGKIDKDMSQIIWDKDSFSIHNLVRGLNPKPVAWTTFRGHHMKIWKTAIFEGDCPELKAGEIRRFEKKRLLAGTGNGIIEILEIQPENKKRMDGLSFINGYRLEAGESFG